jgi:hypothetical protein
MARESSLYRMADQSLDGKMRQIVIKQRKAGRTWFEIAVDLRGRGVSVSHESLRSWFKADTEAAAESGAA